VLKKYFKTRKIFQNKRTEPREANNAEPKLSLKLIPPSGIKLKSLPVNAAKG
jgi:hypothetical protein